MNEQAKPSDYISFDVYTITIDNGKPYEVKADGIDDLRAELKEAYAESQKTDYAYFDVKVYNGDGEDISESQFITEMINDLIEEQGEGRTCDNTLLREPSQAEKQEAHRKATSKLMREGI